MNRKTVEEMVNFIFSDTLMVFLALLVLPIVLGEYLLDLTATQNVILSLTSWIIYSIFVLEFILKIAVSNNRINFLKTNRLYFVISLVIIISPLLEPISELFLAAPLLRAFRILSVIRLSRLTTVLAVSGRARIVWKRINYRTYAIVISVIVFGFLISFFKPTLEISETDQALLSQFIQIIATIYAIITGFIIANVWGKYTSLIRSVNSEAVSLRNVYLFAIPLKNQELMSTLKKRIIAYVNMVVNVYWSGVKKTVPLEKTTELLYTSFEGYIPRDAREIEIFTNIIDELRKASDDQANIKSLIEAQTPKILWTLVVILSSIIIFGFFFLNYDSQLLATLTMTLVSTAIALVITIIYDMNDPFKFGFWAVTPRAYLELEDSLNQK